MATQTNVIHVETHVSILPTKLDTKKWSWLRRYTRVVDNRPVEYLGLLPRIMYKLPKRFRGLMLPTKITGLSDSDKKPVFVICDTIGAYVDTVVGWLVVKSQQDGAYVSIDKVIERYEFVHISCHKDIERYLALSTKKLPMSGIKLFVSQNNLIGDHNQLHGEAKSIVDTITENYNRVNDTNRTAWTYLFVDHHDSMSEHRWSWSYYVCDNKDKDK